MNLRNPCSLSISRSKEDRSRRLLGFVLLLKVCFLDVSLFRKVDCFWMVIICSGCLFLDVLFVLVYYLRRFIVWNVLVLDGFYVIYWHILCRKVKNRVIVYGTLSRRMTGWSPDLTSRS